MFRLHQLNSWGGGSRGGFTPPLILLTAITTHLRMKKAILKRIKQAAAQLPVKLITRPHTQYFSGAEANAAAIQNGDKPIFNPNKSYPTTTPLTFEVNHKQRLKDAYERGGWVEVEKYIALQKGDGV